MDRDETIHRAEMFLSYLREEGRYQFRAGDDPDTWIDLHPYQGQETYLVRFLDPYYQFRIKPQPLECWVWAFDDRSGFGSIPIRGNVEPVTDEAYAALFPGRWVRMREVTNETDD